jgi:hypothetical protein
LLSSGGIATVCFEAAELAMWKTSLDTEHQLDYGTRSLGLSPLLPVAPLWRARRSMSALFTILVCYLIIASAKWPSYHTGRHDLHSGLETEPSLVSATFSMRPHNLNLIAAVETAWRKWTRDLFLSVASCRSLSHRRIRHLSLSLSLPLSPSLSPSLPPTQICCPPRCARPSAPSARPPLWWLARSSLCAPRATWLLCKNLDPIEWTFPPRSPTQMPNLRDDEQIALSVP